MTTSALGPRRGGWQRPISLPADLAELRGPLTGMPQLPLRIYASGQGPARSFDLSNEVERSELYEIVLTGRHLRGCLPLCQSQGAAAALAPAMAADTRTTGVGASAWCRRLVSLDPPHEQIARTAFALPEARQDCPGRRWRDARP
jgi:hypothetical protein